MEQVKNLIPQRLEMFIRCNSRLSEITLAIRILFTQYGLTPYSDDALKHISESDYNQYKRLFKRRQRLWDLSAHCVSNNQLC